MFKIEQGKEIPLNITEKMDDDSDDEQQQSDDNDDDDDGDELRTGGAKILLTAVGIGYHNLTKTLV
jgi:hypothetical protein